MLRQTMINTKMRPTIITSQSLALGRARFQISIVNNVELELKTEVKDDISAEIITASIRPRAPPGNLSITSVGYAIFEQPSLFRFSQKLLQRSGSKQAISSEVISEILI